MHELQTPPTINIIENSTLPSSREEKYYYRIELTEKATIPTVTKSLYASDKWWFENWDDDKMENSEATASFRQIAIAD